MPTKRVLVVHGVPGVGKSALLVMFRLECRDIGFPVALASTDEARSPVHVLINWSADLEAAGIRLKSFRQALKRYRAKTDSAGKATELVKEAVGKTAEVAGGVIAGTAADLGYGPLGGIVGYVAANAAATFLTDAPSIPQADVLKDPTAVLTKCFEADVGKAARQTRLTLMLDTFEKAPALADWLGGVIPRAAPHVFFVVAGRTIPDWRSTWPGWVAEADVQELGPLSEISTRELVRNYRAAMPSGPPTTSQMEAIVRFSAGLPLVVTSAVRLLLKYGVEDFLTVRPQVVSNLVDVIMEGVPKQVGASLETAAVLRWFNKDLLRGTDASLDVDATYDDIRHLPFVRPCREGLALHDAIRRIIIENLIVHDPERYRTLNAHAARFHEQRFLRSMADDSDSSARDDAWTWLIEMYYHRLVIDEETGRQLIVDAFLSHLRRRDLALCEELVGVLDSLSAPQWRTQRWRDYCEILLRQSRSTWEYGYEALQALLSSSLPPELEVEARWNMGITLDYSGQRERASAEFSQALAVTKVLPSPNAARLARILTRIGILDQNFETAFRTLKEAEQYAQKTGDSRVLSDVLNETNYLLQRFDRLDQAEAVTTRLLSIAEQTNDEREMGLAHARVAECLLVRREYSDRTRSHVEMAIASLEAVDDLQSLSWAKRLKGSLLLGRSRPKEALSLFEESIDGYTKRKSSRGLFRSQVAYCECLVEIGEFDRVRQLWPVVEELGRGVDLGDWLARWRVVQGTCEAADSAAGMARLTSVAQRYTDALNLSVRGQSHMAFYTIAERIVSRLRLLAQNRLSRDADFVIEAIELAWSRKPENGRSLHELEVSLCARYNVPSVVLRLKFLLD